MFRLVLVDGAAMDFSISKMCRGDGVAYFEAVVKGSSGDVAFLAFSEEGVQLPLESYLIEESSNCRKYVLASPLLQTKALVFSARDRAGSESKKVKLSRFSIKWQSRLNYKLDADAIYRLRDFDRMTYSNQIHINIHHYIPAPQKGEVIVKGVICSPIKENSIDVALLDGRGLPVESFPLHLHRASEIDYEGVKRLETPFTVRIPDDDATYCLVADGKDECRAGFLCFDPCSRASFFKGLGPSSYRLARSGEWDSFQKKRARKFQLADSSDYFIENGPLISVVVPLYNTPTRFFREMLDSVTGQIYENWELILVNSTPENQELGAELQRISDLRVRIVELDCNLGISENTNRGVEEASGDFIAFFDHDDVLDKFALYRYASLIAEDSSIDALYCDEDVLDEGGHYVNPHFKSDFNLDLLRSHNYITHLLCVKTSYAKQLVLRSEFDGAQDYDFLLRLSEKTSSIAHIPEVLYHWRMSDTSTVKDSASKPYAQGAGLAALNEHLQRVAPCATAEETTVPFLYRTSYRISGSPLVSIVIPNKDSVSVLSRCIESLYEVTDYANFEVVVVENNSVEKETFEFYEWAERKYNRLRVVTWNGPFNYSAINNYALRFAKGEYLLLLNNDIEALDPSWLGSMLGFCQREDVGAVGAKLLYPDGTVQHAGVAMYACSSPAECGGAMHVFNHIDADDSGYMWRASFSQDVSIVTGACLLTKRGVFEALGGLNEDYAVAYNDVDYCLRVGRLGYRVVFDADARLIHYESFSRGSDASGEKIKRFMSEQGRLRLEWSEYYLHGDPYHGKFSE